MVTTSSTDTAEPILEKDLRDIDDPMRANPHIDNDAPILPKERSASEEPS
jgi:hypothetical protein